MSSGLLWENEISMQVMTSSRVWYYGVRLDEVRVSTLLFRAIYSSMNVNQLYLPITVFCLCLVLFLTLFCLLLTYFVFIYTHFEYASNNYNIM